MKNDSGFIPVEFYVVVEQDPEEEVTKGGIIIAQTIQERDKLSACEGTLIAVSPLAFDYAEWSADARKPAVGDRVLFKRHDGWLKEQKQADGTKRNFRLLNDKSIVAIIEEPEAVDQYELPTPEMMERVREWVNNGRPQPVDGQGSFSDERAN